jgi:hypothetical protein
MSTSPETDQITMADLRQACVERLDHAVATNEAGLNVYTGSSGTLYEKFETPAGLNIERYAGLLTIKCDFGELDGDETQVTTVEFVDTEEEPVEVTNLTTNHKGIFSKTVAKKDQNALATELSKLVTLIV